MYLNLTKNLMYLTQGTVPHFLEYQCDHASTARPRE